MRNIFKSIQSWCILQQFDSHSTGDYSIYINKSDIDLEKFKKELLSYISSIVNIGIHKIYDIISVFLASNRIYILFKERHAIK